MKILVVAATESELTGIRKISFKQHELEFLVTGIGMVAATHALTKQLCSKQYDLVIQTGIAGSFDPQIEIGEVVLVTEEMFSELGAEDDDHFINLEQMGLHGTDRIYNEPPKLISQELPFKKVRGITVNTSHGNQASIDKIIQKFHPQVESMEGGAFLYVCKKEKTPSIQLRAISNYVEKRNKDTWKIPFALEKLTNSVEKLLGLL